MRAFFLPLCLLALAACSQVPQGDLDPGEAPTLDSAEAGLWMHMDRIETKLQASSRIVDDTALNDYLNEIACRLEPLYCAGVRIYVVEMPYFNATMAPNGMMEVWTGLLLRVENEAQLAFVLAHELSHYIKRHSLQRWVDLQNKSNAASVFSVLTNAAGVGYAGYIGELAAMASALSYSREQEREADQVAVERLAEAGYEAREAARLWQAVLDEKAASKRNDGWVYLSTHPGTEERIAYLDQGAEVPQRPDAVIGRASLQAVLAPFWDDWLGDELSRGAFDESEVLFRRLLAYGPQRGLVRFHLGELYRKRGREGDLDRAIESYQAALAAPGAPPRTYRSLGQALRRSGRKDEARAAFAAYLKAVPRASDRGIIEYQIERMR